MFHSAREVEMTPTPNQDWVCSEGGFVLDSRRRSFSLSRLDTILQEEAAATAISKVFPSPDGAPNPNPIPNPISEPKFKPEGSRISRAFSNCARKLVKSLFRTRKPSKEEQSSEEETKLRPHRGSMCESEYCDFEPDELIDESAGRTSNRLDVLFGLPDPEESGPGYCDFEPDLLVGESSAGGNLTPAEEEFECCPWKPALSVVEGDPGEISFRWWEVSEMNSAEAANLGGRKVGRRKKGEGKSKSSSWRRQSLLTNVNCFSKTTPLSPDLVLRI